MKILYIEETCVGFDQCWQTVNFCLVDVIKHLLVLDQEQRWSSAMALQKISEILKTNL